MKRLLIKGDLRLYTFRGYYHPFKEYDTAMSLAAKSLKGNNSSKYHKLARRLENKLPRGLREKPKDWYYSATCITLEVMTED